MRIEAQTHVSHPAKLVLVTLRDKTPELAAIMPNVESVEELERREEPPRVHLYNRWQGSNRDVPAILRPFVSKELLAWHDRASWDEEKLCCSWQLEGRVFSCQGSTRLEPQGEGSTLFLIGGELKVDPDRVPGLPRFLARKVQQPLERFIGNAVRPNLTKIAEAVQRFLDEHR
jgi:hypothetical protein